MSVRLKTEWPHDNVSLATAVYSFLETILLPVFTFSVLYHTALFLNFTSLNYHAGKIGFFFFSFSSASFFCFFLVLFHCFCFYSSVTFGALCVHQTLNNVALPYVC